MQEYKPDFDLEKFTNEYIERNPLDLLVIPKITEDLLLELAEELFEPDDNGLTFKKNGYRTDLDGLNDRLNKYLKERYK